MKVIMIECNEEELRANRTVLDSITEAFSSFTRNFAGIDMTPEETANLMSCMNSDEENTDE